MCLASRGIVFDPKDLLQLLIHYTDGLIPLETEVTEFKVNTNLNRCIGIFCKSDKWVDGDELPDGSLSPLQIRYTGKKIMAVGNKGMPSVWYEAPESPGKKRIV
jgi:hypothetical protein